MTKALNAEFLRTLVLVLYFALAVACATHPEVAIDDSAFVDSSAESGAIAESAKQGQEKAIASYRDYLQRYPASPEYDRVARRLADLLLERAASRQLAMPAAAERSAGLQALALRDYAEAISLYERLLANDPHGPDSTGLLYQLSRAYQESGRTKDALEATDRLLAQTSTGDKRLYADTQFRRGELLFAQGAYADAARAYRAVVDLDESVPAYEQSLYKLGWSLFKQDRFEDALPVLFALLDRKIDPARPYDGQLAQLTQADREQIADVFRVISNSYAQLGGVKSVEAYFREHDARSYEAEVYLQLADWYVEQDQVGDAVETWLALARTSPMSARAPRLMVRGIDLYRQAGFEQRQTDLEAVFVADYGLSSEFWSVHSGADFPQVVEALQSSLMHLARFYGDKASMTGGAKALREAVHWHGVYLASFGEKVAAAQMNYQFAELLYEHGQYRQALDEYERTAWSYPPHTLVADAALGAQHASARLLAQEDGAAQQRAISERANRGAGRFIETFSEHQAAPGLLVGTGTRLLEQQQYAAALEVSEKALASSAPSAELRQVACSLRAQSLFGLAQYSRAATAYGQALELAGKDDVRRDALQQGLAIATYRHAEQLLAQGDKAGAFAVFQRAAELAPDRSVRSSASYDAATTLLNMESWAQAIELLEDYRENYPQDRLQAEVTRKLAYAREQNGDHAQAAHEYLALSQDAGQSEVVQREALYRAAQLYRETGASDQAIRAGERYVERFPQPAAPAVELLRQLVLLEPGKPKRQAHWLQEIVRLDLAAGDAQTREPAAQAALALAEQRMFAFRRIQLTAPVQVHLAQKIEAMKRALADLEAVREYGVASVSEAASQHIAGMYDELAVALLSSERPVGLTAEELAEYDKLLSQQAAAFEQQAADIYRSNTPQISRTEEEGVLVKRDAQ